MSLTFSVRDKNGDLMFSGPLFVRDHHGPPVTLEEIVHLCKQADANHLLMPALRLDLQRAMLLADTQTIQAIAGCIVGGFDEVRS